MFGKERMLVTVLCVLAALPWRTIGASRALTTVVFVVAGIALAAIVRLASSAPEDLPDLLLQSRLAWPLAPVSITSLFGQRWHPITGEHRRHLGVDLAAKQGQVIYTAEKGVVLRAGWNGDHGNQVEVQHAGARGQRQQPFAVVGWEGSGIRQQRSAHLTQNQHGRVPLPSPADRAGSHRRPPGKVRSRLDRTGPRLRNVPSLSPSVLRAGVP